ncbi:nuclear transport factor 2 family protein [Micromonospora sp. NPDC049101]|uniref:nuclear transport factor 2 family protein n=1 Tax=unclassified Micromonospora TaxID=2617518 RepID=UPI0033F2F475
MPDDAQRKAVVLEYFERVNAGDIDGLMKLFSPDAVIADPVGIPLVSGEEGLRAYFHRLVHDFGTKDVPGVPTGAQDERSVAIPLTATINNPQGPAGSRLSVNVVSTFEVGRDGTIEAMHAYWGATDVTPVAG